MSVAEFAVLVLSRNWFHVTDENNKPSVDRLWHVC